MKKNFGVQIAIFLFLFLSIGLLLISITLKSYRHRVQLSEMNLKENLPIYYVANKVRQRSRTDEVKVIEKENNKVLVLKEEHDNVKYEHFIYAEQHMLMEADLKEGEDLSLIAGHKIMPIGDISFEEGKSGELRINCLTIKHEKYQILIYPLNKQV